MCQEFWACAVKSLITTKKVSCTLQKITFSRLPLPYACYQHLLDPWAFLSIMCVVLIKMQWALIGHNEHSLYFNEWHHCPVVLLNSYPLSGIASGLEEECWDSCTLKSIQNYLVFLASGIVCPLINTISLVIWKDSFSLCLWPTQYYYFPHFYATLSPRSTWWCAQFFPSFCLQ